MSDTKTVTAVIGPVGKKPIHRGDAQRLPLGIGWTGALVFALGAALGACAGLSEPAAVAQPESQAIAMGERQAGLSACGSTGMTADLGGSGGLVSIPCGEGMGVAGECGRTGGGGARLMTVEQAVRVVLGWRRSKACEVSEATRVAPGSNGWIAVCVHTDYSSEVRVTTQL